ncbi:MAG: hypothetical protein FJX75_17940 [Armatimonadetes bacterium]|nr:hypothetical protein [Armatimonadota bacterium]
MAGAATADTYVVTNADDSGTGSLRWAINQANGRPGADTITFDPAVAGLEIELVTKLPAIRDSYTTIDGDIDDDGEPDVSLYGGELPGGHGLQVEANNVAIVGLSIIHMPWAAIWMWAVADCRVESCWIGIRLDAGSSSNTLGGIALFNTDRIVIGGTTPAARNVFSTGPVSKGTACIDILACRNTTVEGSYLGIKPDGSAHFGAGGWGVRLFGPISAGSRSRVIDPDDPGIPPGYRAGPCSDNVIGGTTPEARNVFGGLKQGVYLQGARNNTIAGNYFGLAPDGETEAPIGQGCIMVGASAPGNTIGGNRAGAGNVFAGAPLGIGLASTRSTNNTIQGNTFGLNGTGTAQRRLRTGILVASGAEGLLIGGGSDRARNFFAPNAPGGGVTMAVSLVGTAGTPVVRNNWIGVLPDGTDAAPYTYGVGSISCSPRITENLIANAWAGVGAAGTGTSEAFNNTFRNCSRAVLLDAGAHGALGDLGDTATFNDGGNVFDASCTWWIRNQTPHDVKAEGNDFGTTSRAAIADKVWDADDRLGRGPVDFDPLIGGVSPTGAAGPTLAIAGASAAPTAAGAEIVFTLSAAASVDVTVLNVAGRPVAMVSRQRPLEAGLQRLVWNALADSGTRVPNGPYLVRIAARDADGRQAQALCRVSISR